MGALDRRCLVEEALVVDAEDQIRAAIIQSLMCYDSLDFDAVGMQHDIDFRTHFDEEIKRLQILADDELIDLDDRGVTITPRGRLLLHSIAMIFDRYIHQDENDNRFSKAI